MQHYWGAQAICDRIGYKTPSRLTDLIIRYQLPAYKRHHPQKKCILVYYSNETLLAKWDLARSVQQREKLIQEREARALAKAEKLRYSQRGLKKRPSPDPDA